MSRDEKQFCIECRDFVIYKIIEKEMTAKLKGKDYKFLGKEAICDNCGEEIYIGDINDYNLKALYDEYRRVNENTWF